MVMVMTIPVCIRLTDILSGSSPSATVVHACKMEIRTKLLIQWDKLLFVGSHLK